jgi:hypothetical protein
MKLLCCIALLLVSKLSSSQVDLEDVHPVEFVVKINDIIIRDNAISYPFIEKIGKFISKRKMYYPAQAMKKFGIYTKDGLLVYTLKDGNSIDFSLNIKWTNTIRVRRTVRTL